MELFKRQTTIPFMAQRRTALYFSAALLLLAIGSLALRGLNFGIDFTGGTLLEVGYSEAVELAPVRSALATAGYGDAVAQYFGTAQDVLIRIAPREGVSSADLSEAIMKVLREQGAEVEMRRQEYVGPQVGEELANDGGLALLYALIGILIYVAFRFEYRFAVGAVAALVHDVLITLGFFALFQIEFDLTVLAALLAVIGYSLNDTIVVFDRIRENFRILRKGTPVEVVDHSLNQTLSRTLMTSFTTILVLLALFMFGGELIHAFATALLVGIFIGTYSSIYVASTTALAMGVSREDLLPVKREGEDLEGELDP